MRKSTKSAVRSRAEAIAVSRTFDWMILFVLFTAVLGGYHIHFMLTGGDWDFWSDWKDRRLWVTVVPIVAITFPAAVQACLWWRYRLPIGATLCVLALLLGEWINRYMNFWGWTYFPINICFPSQLIPGAIILDVILMLSGSMPFTAVVGGLGWGLIFYPSNWPVIAPLHMPVEYNGMMMTLADLSGYHYVRTGTPEYIRMVEKGTLRTFGKDVAPVSAFFSGFVSIIIYFLWHFFGRWFSKTDFIYDYASSSPSAQESPDIQHHFPLEAEVHSDKTLSHLIEAPLIISESSNVEIEDLQDETLKESFYFALIGKRTLGFQIEYGTNVDLIFNYGIPSSTVAKIEGEELEKSRLSDDGELGIAVIPIGLLFRNDEKTDWYKVAKFHKGKILEKLKFKFCAGTFSDDIKNYGFNITIDVRGLVLYSFFLEVRLVDNIDPTLPDKCEKLISLNLDSVNQRVKNFEYRISKEKQYA